jgi:hypothetical protein
VEIHGKELLQTSTSEGVPREILKAAGFENNFIVRTILKQFGDTS